MAQQPAHHNVGFVLGAFAVVHRIALLYPHRGEHALFVPHRQLDIQLVEPLQGLLFELLVVLVRGNIAVGGKNRVARVVVVLVELHQVIVAEVYDVVRLTATVVVVGGRREQVAGQVLPQLGSGRTHGPLHFVIDHAPVHQVAGRVVRLVELQAMAFLGKVQRVQPGEEYRIQVHRQQVVEVLAVHAGERVGGPVAAGKGVHKGVQGTPDHHEKRVANGITLTAAQCRMLENVRNTGGVHREGTQGHEKHVLVVICRQVKMAGTGFLVAILLNLQVKGANPVTANFLESRMDCVVCRCSH